MARPLLSLFLHYVRACETVCADKQRWDMRLHARSIKTYTLNRTVPTTTIIPKQTKTRTLSFQQTVHHALDV